MILSCRGAERQAPNIFQQALRFSQIMELRDNEGAHPKDLNSEARLRRVIDDFQSSPGFHSKWSLDEGRITGILNVICGTSPDARALMREHLHKHKWHQSALNADLLRRPRWLLGACVKGCPDNWKAALTMTADRQKWFLPLVFSQFGEKVKKVRPNQRARLRLAGIEWDTYATFACVFVAVQKEADLLSNAQPNYSENLMKAFFSLLLGFVDFAAIAKLNGC